MQTLRNPDPSEVQTLIRSLLEHSTNVSETARKVGVSRSKLYAWANGSSSPTLEELSQLCTAIGVRVKIEMGPDAEWEVEENTTAILGRLLGNQETILRRLEGR